MSVLARALAFREAILDAPPEVLAAIEHAERGGRVVTEGLWRRVCAVDPAAGVALIERVE